MRLGNIIGTGVLISGIGVAVYGGFTSAENAKNSSMKFVSGENITNFEFGEMYNKIKHLDSLTTDIWNKLEEHPDSVSTYKQKLTYINTQKLNLMTSKKYLDVKEKNGLVIKEYDIEKILGGTFVASISALFLFSYNEHRYY